MKSALDRAEDVVEYVGGEWNETARERIAAMFAEHARDQRHLCAEAADDEAHTLDSGRVHAAVLNARAPGE